MGRGGCGRVSGAKAWRAAWLPVVLIAAGCVTEPALTAPVTSGPVVIESFVGGLAVKGSAFYSFTVPRNGPVALTLLSLTVAGVPSELSINVGLGVPTGTTCNATTSPTFVAINPVSNTNVTPRVYCVLVTDVGTLTDPAEFAVNITRPR